MNEARNGVVHRVTMGTGTQRRPTATRTGEPHARASSTCSGVEPIGRESRRRPSAKHAKASIATTAFALAALALYAAPGDAACEKKYRVSHSEAECLTASWTHSGAPPIRMFRVRNRCPDIGKVVAKIDLAGARDRTWHLHDGDTRHGSTTHRIRDISCCSDLSATCNRSDVFSDSGCVARFKRRSPAAWSCDDVSASADSEVRRCDVTATCQRAWRPGGGGVLRTSLSVPWEEFGSLNNCDGRLTLGPCPARRSARDGLSVADARTREAANAALEFVVTRSGASHEAATVEYSTVDGTATAHADYAPTRGKLTFAIGERAKTVAVAVFDDLHDEGVETLTLVLSNPRGARVVDSTATGTIANDDPLPERWLAGFGRSAAGHVVDAVSGRLEHAMGTASMGDGSVESRRYGDRTTEVVTPRRPGRLGAGNGWRYGDRTTEIVTPLSAPGSDAADMHNPGGHERGLGRAFHISSHDTDGAAIAAWGRFARGGFASDGPRASLDGDVTTTVIGADVGWGRWLAGAAASWSRGDGAYAAWPGDDVSGSVESTLTTLSPYVRFSLGERVSLWGLAGAGSGALTLKQNDGTRLRTDISLRLGAAGVRGTLLPASRSERLEVAVRSDLLWARTDSDGVNAPGRLAPARADAHRLRLMLEGSRSFELEAGATLTPRLEVGVRHDGGEAETGTAVEVGAAMRFAAEGVAIEGSVRRVVVDRRMGHKAWEASGTIRIEPDRFGRGFSLTVTPVVVAGAMGRESLWSLGPALALAGRSDAEPGMRLDTHIGYGLNASFVPGLLTPYTGLSLAGGEIGTWRAGVRWDATRDIVVSLECVRQERPGDDSELVLAQRAELRW